MTKPHGIWPMLYAFFDANDRLDEAAFRSQVRWCLEQGAHGIAMLGLITEVGALTVEEKTRLITWAAEEIGGKVPLLVTVKAPDTNTMIAEGLAARAMGATYVVFQPPPVQQSELLDAYSRVFAEVPGDVGIQNAPEYLGIGLEPAEVTELRRRHPHFSLMKGEGPVVMVKRFLDQLPAEMATFNGRGGLELVDNLIAGCAGMIPAPETLDLQLLIYDAVEAGDLERAATLYAGLLPYAVFSMQTIPVAVFYGKRAFIRRAGIANAGACRLPGMAEDPLFINASRRWFAQLEAVTKA
jgi:2-keto-3-deoxy-L-arabinonate dehydratase